MNARRTACPSIGPKVCPFIFRLAMENGSAAPTRKEKAGWIRSCSEHPCHSTCSVLKPITRQNRLCGNASATTGKCMTSASIRTITSPRNASSEVSRVLPSALRLGSAPGASDTGLSSWALSIMKSSCHSRNTDATALCLNREAWRIRNVPLAAGEIREFLRGPILCYRSFTERSRRTPRGGIVNIDIGHQSPFQAIHQPVAHNVVHSTVATHLACHFSRGFPERMLILVAEGIDIFPIFFLWSIQENTWRKIGEYTLRAGDRIETAVRPWVDHIMLQKNRAAHLGFDDAGVHVATDILFGALRISFRKVRLYISAQRGLGRTHRHHIVKPVSAMDVHVMGDGAESVRRIQMAIALHVRKPPPQAFPFARGQNAPKIVEIRRLSMRDLTEESIPHHAQNHHLV